MKRFLIWTISIIIIPATVLLIIAYTINAKITDPTLLKRLISQENTYSKIVNEIPKYLGKDLDSVVTLSDSEKARVVQSAINQSFFENSTSQSIDEYLLWIKGKNIKSISIDLSKPKEQAIQELTSIYKEKYALLPECSSGELLLNKIQSESIFPTCRISSDRQFESIYKTFDPATIPNTELQNISDKIEIPLAENQIPSLYQNIKFFLLIIALVDLALIIIALALAVKPKNILRFLSAICLPIGLILFTLNYFFAEVLQNEVTAELKAKIADTGFLEIITGLVLKLISKIQSDIQLISLAFLIAFIVLFLASLFFKDRNKIMLSDDLDGPRQPLLPDKENPSQENPRDEILENKINTKTLKK